MKRISLFIISLFWLLAGSICTALAQQTIVTYNTSDGLTAYDRAEQPSEVLDTSRFVVSYRMLYHHRPENDQPMEDLMHDPKRFLTHAGVSVLPREERVGQVTADLGEIAWE